MHDIVVTGGTLVDGSGAPGREADVAIDGDWITAVGPRGSLGPAKRVIDATGKLVTPGFVDIHTHYDAQVSWDPMLTPSSWHGCTTVVMGSCGVGFAPVRPDRHDFLIRLMEGVEDIPGAAMDEGIKWGWESFPEYLKVIESMPHVIDFGVSIAHGPVRAYVMDDRGARNEEATEADVEAMYRIVKEALQAGAMGFSTSRTLLHRSIDGDPVPGTFADWRELSGIGKALRDVNAGVFHVAPDQLRFDEEFPWMEALAKELGRPVTFNLNQQNEQPDKWKDVLARLEALPANVPLYAQAAGRAIGVVMAMDGTAHPLLGMPGYWETLGELEPTKRVAAMQDPVVKAKCLAGEPNDLGEFGNLVTRTFDRMFPVSGELDYEPTPDRSVAAIAKAKGLSPLEVAYDHLAAGGFLYFPLFGYSYGDLSPAHRLHGSARTKMGLGDAGAHCGAVCDGGMPTFMLTHWTRDRTGGRFPIEYVVRRQTRETAELFGLFDRGLVAPGFKADLNVIDYDNLRLAPARMAYDLPAGGRRLLQEAKGYVATICSGVVVSENDAPTGAMPGKLVRGAQARPA